MRYYTINIHWSSLFIQLRLISNLALQVHEPGSGYSLIGQWYRYEKATLYPFSEKMGRKFTTLKWKCLLELIGHEENGLFSDVVMGTWNNISIINHFGWLLDQTRNVDKFLATSHPKTETLRPYESMPPKPSYQPHFGSLPIADLILCWFRDGSKLCWSKSLI